MSAFSCSMSAARSSGVRAPIVLGALRCCRAMAELLAFAGRQTPDTRRGSVGGTGAMKMRFTATSPAGKCRCRTARQEGTDRPASTKKAPIVRLPPKSNFEMFLAQGSQASLIVIGFVAFIFALHAGEYILAPIAIGIVIGLMLGPLALRLERRGMPSGLSALIVFALFIALVVVFALVITAPLSVWSGRSPADLGAVAGQLSQLQAADRSDHAPRATNCARSSADRPHGLGRRRLAGRERRHARPGRDRADPDLSGQPLFLRRDAP